MYVRTCGQVGIQVTEEKFKESTSKSTQYLPSILKSKYLVMDRSTLEQVCKVRTLQKVILYFSRR